MLQYTICKHEANKLAFLHFRQKYEGRLCFDTCLSVHMGEGGVPTLDRGEVPPSGCMGYPPPHVQG